MWRTKHEEDYPNTSIVLQVAVFAGPSNAQAERFFSRVTKLTESRKSTTLAPLLNSIVTVQELSNKRDILQMPEEFWEEVTQS